MNILAWERAAFSFLHPLSGKSSFLDLIFSFLENYLIWLLVLVFLLILIQAGTQRRFFRLLVSALSILVSIGLMEAVLNFFIRRSNPLSDVGTHPFLPTQSVLVFALAWLLIEFGKRRIGAWYVVLGFLAGASQVITGSHWPLDIVISAAVGILGVLLISLLIPFTPAKKMGL